MWAGGDVLLQQDSDQLLPSPSLGTSQPGPPWAAAHVLLPRRREVRQRERQVLESAGTGPGRGRDVPTVSYGRSDAWQPLPVSSGRHVLCHLSGTYSTNEPLAQATRKVIGVSLVLVLDSLRRENRRQCVTVSSALVRQSSLAVICICV